MTKSVMTVMRSLLIVFCLTTFVQPLMARTLRAMTFNIRLGSADDGINSWKYRCDDVRSFIKTMKPDVFGVQEAVPEQMKFLSDTLKDYAHVGVGREDGKDGGEHMAVFYRKDLYKLVNSGNFWLSETPEVPSKGWDAACKRICTWAVLQNVKNGKSFLFANTHLDHVGETARVNGAMLVKQRLSRLDNGLPVIVTGDFNVTETSPSYATMRDRIFPLVDSHKQAKKVLGMKASYHGYGSIPDEKGDKIDFIFVSPGIKVKKSHIFNSLIGDGRYLSDHHPVYVDLSGKMF